MRGLVAAIALTTLPIAGSCVLFLDFDELTAGSGGASFEAGSTTCAAPGDCNDGNPCTEDTCDTATSPGKCVYTPRAVVPDGLSRTLQVARAHRLSLASSGARYYLSAFVENAGSEPDVTFHMFS